MSVETKKKLQRIDLIPTKETLVEKMIQNSIGRNDDLVAFLDIIDSVEGGMSFFIDSKWGNGKTFFVKQAILLLEHLNKHMLYNDDRLTKLLSEDDSFKGLSLEEPFLPIYYNAWEHDSYDDPLITLMGIINLSVDNINWDDSIPTKNSEKITAIIDAILTGLTPLTLINFGGIAKGLIDGFSAQHLFDSMQAETQIKNKLSELIDEILKERANKMVLFIDELDRCNPPFAFKLLERIKYLFEKDNIIIIFSTDHNQLTETIKGYYGEGIDGGKYLSRFYDQKLCLTPVKPHNYLQSIGFNYNNRYFNLIAYEIAEKLNFAMRDFNRYVSELNEIMDPPFSSRNVGGKLYLFELVFAPVLVAISIYSSSDYQKIISGAAFELLENYVRECSSFQEILSEIKKSSSNEEMTDKDYFKSVYDTAFRSNEKILRTEDEQIRFSAEKFLSLGRYNR